MESDRQPSGLPGALVRMALEWEQPARPRHSDPAYSGPLMEAGMLPALMNSVSGCQAHSIVSLGLLGRIEPLCGVSCPGRKRHRPAMWLGWHAFEQPIHPCHSMPCQSMAQLPEYTHPICALACALVPESTSGSGVIPLHTFSKTPRTLQIGTRLTIVWSRRLAIWLPIKEEIKLGTNQASAVLFPRPKSNSWKRQWPL